MEKCRTKCQGYNDLFCPIKGISADKDLAVVHIKERALYVLFRVVAAVRVFGLFPDNLCKLQRLWEDDLSRSAHAWRRKGSWGPLNTSLLTIEASPRILKD
jgi:hypothetical protein